MITRRKSSRAIKISPIVYYITRGLVGGILFGVVFNYERWNCLRPIPDFEEVYKTREPSIPQKFMANLSSPEHPISGDRKFIQKPWKVLKTFESDPRGKYFVIFLVSMSPQDAKRRFHARLSWASISEIEGKRIGVMFVVRSGINDAHDKLLADENELYGDILQADFNTGEKGLESLMILSGYQWCIENVADRSDHFVNIRSDIFPHLPNIYEYILKMDESVSKDAIHCGFKQVASQHRPSDPSSPRYVKRTVYENPYFPSHCESTIVILSTNVMRNLYHTATITSLGPIPQGDVYVWGIIREKLRDGGKKNLISANELVKYKEMLPLGYLVEFFRSKAIKDVKLYWERTKERLLLGEKDELKDGSLRHAKIVPIPTTDDKITPEDDMKTFIYKWGRLPMSKRNRD